MHIDLHRIRLEFCNELAALWFLSLLAVVVNSASGASVAFQVVDDETGEALGGHIYVTKGLKGREIGAYKGESLWRGPRCQYASFGSEGFTLDLPAEPSRLWIERGREYLPVVRTYAGGKPTQQRETVRLRRFINMNEKGWWSSDLHIHRGPDVTAQQIRREDVNVAFPLTWWNRPRFAGELTRWADRSEDGRTVWLDQDHVLSLYNMEFEADPYGAVFLLHLKKFIEGRVPPVEQVCLDAARAGGFVNAAKPLWKCSVESVILGQAGMMEVVNNHYLWPKALNNEAWGFPRNFAPTWRTYEKEFIGYAKYNCDIYYALLNCGYRLTAVGGTADGVLGTHIGYNRTYVYTGDKTLDLDRWLDALRAGRTFATNGPMLFATIGDQMPGGEVRLVSGRADRPRVRVDVISPDPIDHLEIIHNGEVVDRLSPRQEANSNPPYRLTYDRAPVAVERSGWIAVRAFSRVEPENVGLAHTTPVWFRVGDEPVRPRRAEVDALIQRVNWWIDWASTHKPDAEATYRRLLNILLAHRERAR